MASVQKRDIPDISDFMTEFWVMVKKYWIPESGDSSYWDELIQAADELAKKYGNEFCKKQIMAYLDYLEHKEREVMR